MRPALRSRAARLAPVLVLLALVAAPPAARAGDDLTRERNLVQGLDSVIEQNRADGERVLSVGGEPFNTEAEKIAVAHRFFTGETRRFDVLYQERDGSKRVLPVTLTPSEEPR